MSSANGNIEMVDVKRDNAKIVHGPLFNLDLPVMTVKPGADDGILAKMSARRNVAFNAEPVKGKATVAKRN